MAAPPRKVKPFSAKTKGTKFIDMNPKIPTLVHETEGTKECPICHKCIRCSGYQAHVKAHKQDEAIHPRLRSFKNMLQDEKG